jgi:pimeloyl-ACP methyl ester carboxylesterase
MPFAGASSEHWRALHGEGLPFDAEEFRRLEAQLIDHAGRHDSSFAHALASQEGFDRRAELARVRTPTLVIESPEDPIAGSQHARSLAQAIPGARLVTMPGMGHSLPAAVLEPLAAAILQHTTGRPPAAPASLGQT